MLCCNSVARFGGFGLIFSKYWHFHVIFGGFWQILNLPKSQNYQISKRCQIWIRIFTKNCQFWRFWQISGKKCTWIIWWCCSNRASNTRKRSYLCPKPLINYLLSCTVKYLTDCTIIYYWGRVSFMNDYESAC